MFISKWNVFTLLSLSLSLSLSVKCSRDQSKKLPQERGANHEDLHSTWVLHLFVIFVTAYLDIKNKNVNIYLKTLLDKEATRISVRFLRVK